jgi:hypothetical protein
MGHQRIQVTMEPELQRRATAKADELGISFAEYVRRLVEQDLGESKRKTDISVLFDLVRTAAPTNIARDKQKMIGQAVWEEHLQETGGKARGPSKPRRR